MRHRLEYAGVLWLMIDQELRNWVNWSDGFRSSGLVPEDVVRGLAGAEEAWEYAAEYHSWASAELEKVNWQLEWYYRMGHYIELSYGIDMVGVFVFLIYQAEDVFKGF